MIDRIQTHIMDLMVADTSLMLAGGSAYAPGWSGLTREMTSQTWIGSGTLDDTPGIPIPREGYVNLFDRAYTKDSEVARPAIYLGGTAYEAIDSEDFDCISAGQLVEYRVLKLQLMICAMHTNQYTARAMKAQLRFNMRKVLRQYLVLNGYWWQMRMPGIKGGGDLSERHWMSTTGQGSQGIAEACCTLPVAIHYQINANTQYA